MTWQVVLSDEKLARELVEQRKAEEKAKANAPVTKVSLEDLFSQIQAGEMKNLNLKHADQCNSGANQSAAGGRKHETIQRSRDDGDGAAKLVDYDDGQGEGSVLQAILAVHETECQPGWRGQHHAGIKGSASERWSEGRL